MNITGDFMVELKHDNGVIIVVLAVSYDLFENLSIVHAYAFNSEMKQISQHYHKHSNPFECMQTCLNRCLETRIENV